MPTEKAHGLQIAKMCEAYAKLGHDVELVVPYRKNTIQVDIFIYYGLERKFRVNTVNIFDTIRFSKWFPRVAYWLQAILFLWALKEKQIPKDACIMTRSFDVAWWYTRRGYQVIAEVHDFSRTRAWWNVLLLKNVSLLVCNSQGTETTLHAHGLRQTHVVPNGVDIASMRPSCTRGEMRARWGVSENEFVVMYIGALEDWKGYKTVLNTSDRCTDMTFIIVGGNSTQIRELRVRYPRVRFLGYQPYRKVANFQNMADVLLIPNDPAFEYEQAHTSPIKLFSSLASGIPVIVTDLANIRALADDSFFTMFDGSTEGLESAIRTVKREYGLAQEKSRRAEVFVQRYTWEKRAQTIALL